jgi:outer membrane lipoprotein LolB
VLRRCGRALGLAGLFAIAGVLQACASLPADPALFDALPLRHAGRMALRVEGDEQRSMSAAFELRGDEGQGFLALSTPLGTQLARVSWQGEAVWAQSSEGSRRYRSLSALAQDVFGEALPLQAWFDWLDGRPWPGAPAQAVTGTATGMATDGDFEQLGWHVQLDRRTEGLVVARRPVPAPLITLRVKLDLD